MRTLILGDTDVAAFDDDGLTAIDIAIVKGHDVGN
jgi:hypothetical protein